jgi:AraC-like DNA-binding protein
VGTFAPGQLVFVTSKVPHNWVSEIGNDEIVLDRDLVIQFQPELLDVAGDCFPELRRLQASPNPFDQSWEYTGKAAQLGAQMMEEIRTLNGVPRLLKFLQLIHLLATTLERRPLGTADYVPSLNPSAVELIERAIRIILSSLPAGVGLEEISSQVGMSPTAFSRYFKRNVGHTFVAYARKLRISDARRLLAETDRPITDLCFDVGYSNISNFNRSFLKECGMTPSAYRRLRRSPDELATGAAEGAHRQVG